MESYYEKMNEMKARAVDNFGTENANCHIGHLVLQSIAEAPDRINQIDAGTGEKETNASVLRRSIRLAMSLRKAGLKPGDVLALSGPNHLHLTIPYYAALYNGLPIMGLDPFFKYEEIKVLFSLSKPKVVFCQEEKLKDISAAIESLGLDTKILTFDGENTVDNFVYSNSNEEDIKHFKAADFDLTKIYTWLVSTSGSTGVPKLAAFASNMVLDTMLFFMIAFLRGQTGEIYLTTSPVQWISAYFTILSAPLLKNTILKTSAPATMDHLVDIINKYKPTQTLFSPSLVSQILKYTGKCDLTCFNSIHVTGANVYKDVLLELKSRTGAKVVEAYAQTECLSPTLMPTADTPIGSCGKPIARYQIRLVDPETDKIITEPRVPGEYQIKGPIFTEYYNNPEETAKSFTEDGWFKSGDILYRDENDFYYFVERYKMLIKYKNYHIVPPELEEVIRRHEDVLDVAITGIPHPDFGELVVACVVKRPGSDLSAQEIKDLVASNLSDSKKLHGGVVFMDSLPMTSTGKVARNKLKEYVMTTRRE